MNGNIIHVFPGNNSAEGFFSFYHSGLQGLKKIYILKGGPGTGKSTLMRNIGLALSERRYDIEFWQCSSDNHSLDGVLVPALKVAVIDGTAPHVVDPVYPGAVEEIINLGEFWDGDQLRTHAEDIRSLTDQIGKVYRKAFKKLAEAGDRERERIARCDRHCDRDVVRKAEEDIMMQVFDGDSHYIRHLFADAVTPEGPVDYRMDITAKTKKRLFLIGPPGEGRQRILNAIVAKAEKRQMAADVFHNGLLPENLEMVVLADLDIAVIAMEKAPEETRNGDQVITLTSPNLSCDREAAESRDRLIKEASSLIMESHLVHDKLESYYRKAMDFEKVGQTQEKLMREILK